MGDKRAACRDEHRASSIQHATMSPTISCCVGAGTRSDHRGSRCGAGHYAETGFAVKAAHDGAFAQDLERRPSAVDRHVVCTFARPNEGIATTSGVRPVRRMESRCAMRMSSRRAALRGERLDDQQTGSPVKA